jgi:lipoprotein-anchoring transpeptidase ErfK/SrfK
VPLPPAQPRAAQPPGSTVAVVREATTLRSTPAGAAVAPQPLRTTFGSPTVLLVRQIRPGWVGVVSPLVGNGRLGWLPVGAVSLSRVDWSIHVSLGRRELTVMHGHTVRARYRIAIGRPSAPTPTGTFAVTDRLSTGDPSGAYGCCILALSALAPHAIQGWGGGNRIAIHSTPPDTYWSLGEPISHGCIHVTLPQGQWLMDHVPLGTPAIIRS